MASLVMKTVLNCVLSQDPEVRRGTSAYIDDILVNESVVSVHRVKRHLAHYGLTCKTHERVAHGVHLLGLKRDNDVGVAADELTRRSVFSYCSKLVGHFPVCGWLRIAATYIKRKANDATTSWDEVIEGGKLRDLIQETALVAVGVALEIGGSVVEDVAWLSPDDAQHINMAELDAIIKGFDMAFSWQITKIRLMTDSTTVHQWVTDGLSRKTRTGEMLIRRKGGIVLLLVEEFVLELYVELVRSANNKVDELTRQWLKPPAAGRAPVCAATADLGVGRMIADVHNAVGHPGIKRTLCFAWQTDPTVFKQQVRHMISNCEPCKSLDPAAEKWKRGNLEVEEAWQRVGDHLPPYEDGNITVEEHNDEDTLYEVIHTDAYGEVDVYIRHETPLTVW
ncbi:conserved hypothetical protein [Trichinella spiralis]|uniref:hypothetical protein n=1 Tax=Trichinella spiralis TaxID=6334 RepID=UPI0001EFC76E|nr:conserved hypothetical protein [Trichinella spiralis]